MKFHATKTMTNHYMAYSKETSKRTAAAYLPFYIHTSTDMASRVYICRTSIMGGHHGYELTQS